MAPSTQNLLPPRVLGALLQLHDVISLGAIGSSPGSHQEGTDIPSAWLCTKGANETGVVVLCIGVNPFLPHSASSLLSLFFPHSLSLLWLPFSSTPQTPSPTRISFMSWYPDPVGYVCHPLG
jgi:hypothetical protein